MSARRRPRFPAAPREPRVPRPLPAQTRVPVPARGAATGARPRGTEQRLRAALERFAAEAVGAAATVRALDHYGDAGGLTDDSLISTQWETAGFLEWLIHDYETERGDRLIERYAHERAANLRPPEREMLALWQAESHLRLMEVQAVSPGRGVLVEDLLNGERVEVAAENASRDILRWQLVLARARSGDRHRIFAGPLLFLSPHHKPVLVTGLTELWDRYRAANPSGAAAEFYRLHGLDLLAAARARQAIDEREPILTTEEGHEAVQASAAYDLADGQAAVARLREAPDFVFSGPASDHGRAVQFI